MASTKLKKPKRLTWAFFILYGYDLQYGSKFEML